MIKLHNLTVTCSFIIINVDPFQLEVGITVVSASWIDAVLIRDYLPELKSESKLERKRTKILYF